LFACDLGFEFERSLELAGLLGLAVFVYIHREIPCIFLAAAGRLLAHQIWPDHHHG